MSLSLFWNSTNTKDLSVETDYCLDCYEQSLDQDNSAVLTSTITRSY